jgi:nucleoside-diphosphate-sugar epimerase
MKLARRKVLVLGGLGFIGSNLALRLVQEEARVTLVDSMLPAYGGNLHNIEPIQNDVRINFSDIRDRYSLNYIVRDVDIIFSVAGQTSHIESMTDPMTDLEINCASQLSLLESCRAHNPGVTIVYTSTRQLYGRPQYLPVDELHPIEPVDVNGINKLAAEYYYTLYSNVYGMRCISLRLTNTYGPRQQLRGDKQGFAGVFLRKAIDGEPITIFGDGSQRRDFNYIDDVVEALLLAATHPALKRKVYNLGARETYSLLDFTNLLHRHCRFEHRLVPFPETLKKIDVGDFYSDFTAFEQETGWRPRVGLEEGLRRTVDFFRPRIDHYR